VRNQPLGRRCYLCKWGGQTCENRLECCSQNCQDGVCVGAYDFDRKHCFENIIISIDGSTGNDYVGAPIDESGLMITTNGAPVRGLKVCPNRGCTECDPTCYTLEGKCEEGYKFVQGGDLILSQDNRETCTELPIVGKHQFTDYKLSLGCVRGPMHCTSCDPLTDPLDNTLFRFAASGSVGSGSSLTTIFVYEFSVALGKNGNDFFLFDYIGDCSFKSYSLKKSTEYYKSEKIKGGQVEVYRAEAEPNTCKYGAKVDSLGSNGETLVETGVARGDMWLYYIYIDGPADNSTFSDYTLVLGDQIYEGRIEVPSCPMKCSPLTETFVSRSGFEYQDKYTQQGVTVFVYEWKYTGHGYTGHDSFIFDYEGGCEFVKYQVRYKKGDMETSLSKEGQVVVYKESYESDTCMQGGKVDVFEDGVSVVKEGEAVDNTWAYFIIVKGGAEEVGIAEGRDVALVQGDAVNKFQTTVPKCLPRYQCDDISLKVGEVDLYGKCNEGLQG